MHNLNSLLPIAPVSIGSQEVNAIDGRALHVFLEIGKDYTNWMKVQVDRAHLVEHQDFEIYAQKGENPRRGRPTKEYMLSLESAKHISMMSGTEKGREARNYFIECERIVKAVVVPVIPSGPVSTTQMFLMAGKALEEHENRLASVETTQATLASRLDAIETSNQAVQEAFEDLPAATESVPDLTARSRVNMVIRSWAQNHGNQFNQAWNKLYEQFYYRFNIDLKTRARNRGIHPLDMADELGEMDRLYALAMHLFGGVRAVAA